MLVAIGVVTGLRDQNSLFCIFFLSVATMWCGLLTEVVSRPAKNANGKPNYELWEGDKKGDTLIQRLKNYAWRMLPHALGFLPYCAAWAVIINNFFEQVDDLCDNLKEKMPDFVPWIVYGCCAIFSTFTFVQWRYQWTAPKHYWRTEVWYCVLSATSKVFLGGLLYSNVLVKASFDESVSPGQNSTSATEEFC